ncbi:MAG TPA: 3-mercaptopyruvate sulfurtransferase [Stellaceae bacterium]|nr:3-mercaptopyruvate sulfurtransferase [Stellaceae bacterium]
MPYANSDALVSTEWLAAHLDAPDLRIIDGTFTLPGVTPTGHELYAARHIPGAVFFDIDEIADDSNPLPHMLPSPEKFSAHMRKLGLGDGHKIVVYDSAGLSSAGRPWWMLRVFGHQDVVILDGGLPKWQAEGRSVTDDIPALRERHFTARLNTLLVRDKQQMVGNLTAGREQVIDARARARFEGSAKEPRAGLRSGHIPGSLNLPFDELTDRQTRTLLPAETLAVRFAEAGLERGKPVVASCGSGVTACALAFGLHLLGWPDAAVYDGSWSEWGLPGDTPVATGPR